MTPYLVTPPASPVVSLDEIKAHLRLGPECDDELETEIAALEAAAVGWLDGWRGILGRGIVAQTWAVAIPASGRWRLPLPDVATVTAKDANGDPVAAEISDDHEFVTIEAAATVEMTVSMPAAQLAMVKAAIKMLVAHWYTNRSAVVTGTIATELPLTVEALLAPLRHRVV